jgi:long-chain acyl-CoA synthetase
MASDLVLAAWDETLRRRARDMAIGNPLGETVRTFSDIDEEARRIVRERLSDSLVPGSVIAVQLGNHPSWPAWLLASLKRELVVLPLEPEIAEEERETVLQICHAAAVVSADESSGSHLTIRPPTPVEWGEHPPTLLKLTSGTTAAPRAIRFRSAQLRADCEQICDTMGITQRDVNFGVIPVSHSYGFSNLLTPLIVRGVPLILSRDRMPRAVLDDLARTGATVFAGMPIFYQAFAEMNSAPVLPKLRLCISAGAPLPLPVAQKFREKFGLAIHSFYGSSECGGICYDRGARLEQSGFVGQAMSGVELETIESATSATRIRVRSAAVADGYFPENDPEKLGNGIFGPDDLLQASSGGFRIVGRVSDLINVAGKKVNPAEVEAVLLRFAGVREAVVFGRGSVLRNEEVVACVVMDATVAEPVLLDFCRRRLSGWQVPKAVFFLDHLPVNARGKISRRALAEQFVSA